MLGVVPETTVGKLERGSQKHRRVSSRPSWYSFPGVMSRFLLQQALGSMGAIFLEFLFWGHEEVCPLLPGTETLPFMPLSHRHLLALLELGPL